MSIEFMTQLAGRVGELLERHAPLLAVAAVVVVIGALVWVLVAHRRRLDRPLTWLAVGLATAFSAEGMWEVARGPLGLSAWLAAGLFIALEVAMTAQALQARRRLADPQRRHPGVHGLTVWIIAAGAAVISASNASSVTEALVRLAMPILASGMWWVELLGHAPDRPRTSTLRWTPRRLLVRLGALEPGERDVAAVHRDHRVAAIVRAGHRLHCAGGPGWLQDWRARRLRRLALDATADIVAEAVDRLHRVYEVVDLTAPPTDSPNDRVSDGSRTGTDDNLGLVREPDQTRSRSGSANGTANHAATVRELPSGRVADSGHNGSRTGRVESANPRLGGSRTSAGVNSARSSNSSGGPRTTVEDYARLAAASWRPGIKLTAAWVAEQTGCAKSTSYKVVDLLLAANLVRDQEQADEAAVANTVAIGSRTDRVDSAGSSANADQTGTRTRSASTAGASMNGGEG